jgi:lipooligosaccharide transport system ATP-binding protein
VRHALWSRVRDLRASGVTVLLTTHYMDEAQRLCDCVAIVAAGKIIAEGAPLQLIEEHLAPEAVEFDCSSQEEAALLDGFSAAAQRLRAGHRLMVFLQQGTALAEHIRSHDRGDRRALVVRPANLEDVFLFLTGTSLEGA